MPVHLKLDGVGTLASVLRGLPAELRDDALPIVGEAVDVAEAEIRAAYPERSGNLRAGLRQERQGGGLNFGARVVLKNTAKHAFLFETGSEYRHPDPAWVRRTRRGKSRGRMPAGHGSPAPCPCDASAPRSSRRPPPPPPRSRAASAAGWSPR